VEKRVQILACILIDIVSINAAWAAYYHIRVNQSLLGVGGTPDFLIPMFVVYMYWVVLFLFSGLYRPLYASSRLDEQTRIFKAAGLGCLVLFFVIFVDDAGNAVGISSRLLIAIYWGIFLLATGSGRLLIRSVQKHLLLRGIGRRRTIIVGSRSKALELFDGVKRYPSLGYEVVGFVGLQKWKTPLLRNSKQLGTVDRLSEIIRSENAAEVLIALESSDHGRLVDIIARCNSSSVSLKIMPDLYDIISGQARTNQIYGFPLIEISPQLMPPWEEAAKRALDIVVSGLVLLIGFPVFGLIALAIKIDSPGGVLYRQERVGKDGKHFNIIKFRSMRQDAERNGAQWAQKRDPRVTNLGRWLRQLHLDELPQVFNVLKGEMSLIGPRPERPVFVEKLSKEIPLYPRRLKVRPGVTGWAQVKHKYDETVEDVRKKVEYDLFYIENMSIKMDIKIMLYTAVHMIMGKGH
jgi:exopolysaccharide biosynthesis polyprenyl glycosylphosphotransferase